MLAALSLSSSAFVPRAAPKMQAAADASFAKALPGATAPLGYFDPLGFCNAEETRVRFYREVEVKHGRVAMLASLGFLVAEGFHPLFGGSVDVPSYLAFQQTPLQDNWKVVMAIAAVIELSSISAFYFPIAIEWKEGERNVYLRPWQIRSEHAPGDLGFDPMGLKPKGAASLEEMQAKELNNGRAPLPSAQSFPRVVSRLHFLSCRRLGDDRHRRHARAGAGFRPEALLSHQRGRLCVVCFTARSTV